MRPHCKIVKFSITKVEEEQAVADALLRGDIIVADLSVLPDQHYDLVISFLEGVLFGINNQMVYLRDDLVLLLPDNIVYEGTQNTFNQGDSAANLSML